MAATTTTPFTNNKSVPSLRKQQIRTVRNRALKRCRHHNAPDPTKADVISMPPPPRVPGQARFQTEVHAGAKLFLLTTLKNGRYLNREVHNLARFISVTKPRPLSWRLSHPYVLVDRVEEMTPAEHVRQEPGCDREVALYGYVRGCNLRGTDRVHLAGVGDFGIKVGGRGGTGAAAGW